MWLLVLLILFPVVFLFFGVFAALLNGVLGVFNTVGNAHRHISDELGE